ncbi:hypothetical protein HanPI659440_Chr09g0335251 [Helianthus annuus]|nr:hypothetical protein HanPI659440_Chr09g0335251 [Helianthus annuus]
MVRNSLTKTKMQICGQVGGENELKFGTFARIGTVPVQNLNKTRYGTGTGIWDKKLIPSRVYIFCGVPDGSDCCSQREYRYGIETREMGEHEID